ncbi:dihydropteroate synthase [Corynebacterium glucuronolyticum]|uniref:Dihydropteroate synthase n=2 Tax=Corynebacterium glucuronolyticum TaxID=39791 RepID=A0AAX1L7P4_9CORY|nr:dihydropteroate synthase [Corynebacterium glucuronolyticum]EEI64162.1 dihydropteroate synthase [Corynebacterium glucuronolyticum ATCC 51866]QRP70280.1 dihydropteroate synthase [Corynebacterium glucuronolyticum]
MDLFNADRCLVMGVLNVTDDSFSDGGKWNTFDRAIAHAHDLVDQGADIIDVGGESTRPGATRVTEEQELARVVPVIEALSKEGIATSVDTMRAAVARASASAGVTILNDVSGGMADPNMFATMADTGLPVILQHWDVTNFGDAAGDTLAGKDVVAEVLRLLGELVHRAQDAGVKKDNIIIDPGLGFGKSRLADWQLLNALPKLVETGYPVLIGQARKRFLGDMRAEYARDENTAVDRDDATHAVSALSAYHGAWAVRVHSVRGSRDAVEVAARWRNPRG